MIKFKGTRDGKPLYGFGLSEGNLQKLRQDMPIVVELEQLGLTGSLVIFYGKTESEIYKMMKDGGLIGPDTKMHEQKKHHEG